ncbi:hypothetical protein Tco_0209438 [Tanacetum coccineum]
MEYKFQDQENSEFIFSIGRALDVILSCSIQITNEMDAFVKLKDEHGENLLVHIENTIESNGWESGAKVRLVSKV